MKKSKWFLTLAAGVLAATFAARVLAADNSEVTLTGMMVCGKCKLHVTDECQNVLQVEKNGQTVNYFLTMNKVAKDFHSEVCQNDGEKVTVTGTVTEKDGKETMSASKIEAVKP
jgi:type 1 fimbria pilin